MRRIYVREQRSTWRNREVRDRVNSRSFTSLFPRGLDGGANPVVPKNFVPSLPTEFPVSASFSHFPPSILLYFSTFALFFVSLALSLSPSSPTSPISPRGVYIMRSRFTAQVREFANFLRLCQVARQLRMCVLPAMPWQVCARSLAHSVSLSSPPFRTQSYTQLQLVWSLTTTTTCLLLIARFLQSIISLSAILATKEPSTKSDLR